jgi:hypothetical protein
MWYCQKQKNGRTFLMMFWCMMFAGVFGAIEDTLPPKILELALKALIH